MSIHVVRGISEETIHDKSLRIDAVNQRESRLDTHTNTHIYKYYYLYILVFSIHLIKTDYLRTISFSSKEELKYY